MSRINTNISSLVATRVLGANNRSLSRSLERLSTGLRINSGKDDPSGLIASETLRSSKRAITAALDNANRADNIVAVAEGGLSEVNSLLLELEDLVDRSANTAGLSADEVSANQLQIDSILQSITRISGSVSFGDKKLLNGDLAFNLSGVTASQISNVQVNAARIAAGSSRTVVVDVVTSAQNAALSYTSGTLTDNVTIQVRGNHGTDVFSFISGTTISSIADSINTSTQLTGVSASVSGGNITINSTGYGRDALVSIEALSGAFDVSGGSDGNLDYGVDPTVTINGTNAVIKNGLTASVRTGSLSVDLTLAAGFATQVGTDGTFAITGGGAVFSLSPEVGLAGQESLGLQSVAAGSLGNGTDGFLASLGSG
ncbi:MAG TPA: flagellin, partial [Phycisphaerae bacterium]